MTRSHPKPFNLIGWSLGGIYARELTKRLAGRVGRVIMTGTPFAVRPDRTHATGVYRRVNAKKPPFDAALARHIAAAPQVPTTSIYSRSDGVAAWQACIQKGQRRRSENIEVTGSHCGLGWNSEVFRIVADRVRQR